jgi:hypothetical protein
VPALAQLFSMLLVVTAAAEGQTISVLITERLESMVRERKAFEKARRYALARLRRGLDLGWKPPNRVLRNPEISSWYDTSEWVILVAEEAADAW